jgi:hypothetical protein
VSSLFDHVTPSERAADLLLNVRRVRSNTNLGVVPILVVEGEGDESVFGELAIHGRQQVFPAGTKSLVEQLLRHMAQEGRTDCACIYLVDCDGTGKTASLASESTLVVTETCDIEADLIHLGIAKRAIRPFCDSDAVAESFIARACEIAMPLSIVRRAAHSVSVSMKKDQRPLRLADMSGLHLDAWEARPAAPEEIVDVLAPDLGWSASAADSVKGAIGTISDEFSQTCLGKDALDALYRLMKQEGQGEIKGWSHRHFFRTLFVEIRSEDLDSWEVGRRIRNWEDETGHKLLSG